MARARNIKPSFFTSEQLSDNCPLGRLLFIGLWTLADYKGDLEWKERTIKIQILPWDDCDIKQLAINLDKSGLVRFFSDGEKLYLNIPNFVRHQNPHKNEREKGSDVPAFTKEMRQAIDLTTLAINLDKSGVKRNDSASNPADSLLLNPESPNPESSKNTLSDPAGSNHVQPQKSSSQKIKPEQLAAFEKFYAAYPRKVKKQDGQKAFAKIKLDQHPLETILTALERYKLTTQWQDKTLIPHPATWLNGQQWLDELDERDMQPSQQPAGQYRQHEQDGRDSKPVQLPDNKNPKAVLPPPELLALARGGKFQ